MSDPRSRAVRLLAFTAERFPPAPQLILVVCIWAAGLGMAVLIWTPTSNMPASLDISWWRVALTLVGSLLFMFHLRVFDDVKDADHDRVHETSRPIPRGLVSESDVNLLAGMLLVTEALIFAAVGPLALVTWLVSAIYSLLMRVEFFIGDWLDRHVLTYAVSHMVIMGLLLITIIGAGSDALRSELYTGTPLGENLIQLYGDQVILGIAIAAFLIGVGFELGRKFERYHAAHGAIAYVLWSSCPVLGCIGFIWATLDYPSWVSPALTTITVVAAIALGVVTLRGPRSQPFEKMHRALVDALPGVTGLLLYLVLAVAGAQEVLA